MSSVLRDCAKYKTVRQLYQDKLEAECGKGSELQEEIGFIIGGEVVYRLSKKEKENQIDMFGSIDAEEFCKISYKETEYEITEVICGTLPCKIFLDMEIYIDTSADYDLQESKQMQFDLDCRTIIKEIINIVND